MNVLILQIIFSSGSQINFSFDNCYGIFQIYTIQQGFCTCATSNSNDKMTIAHIKVLQRQKTKVKRSVGAIALQFLYFFILMVVVYLLSCVWLFCDPMDYSPPGFSVHGISQARTLEWAAITFSRGPFNFVSVVHLYF